MNAQFIKDALRKRHDPAQWVFVEELRLRTMYDHHLFEQIAGVRTMDAFALNLWPSKGYERVGYEVKVEWGDLTHELAHPEKRAQAYLATHRFYFAVPEELAAKHRKSKPAYAGLSRARGGTFWERLGGAGIIAVRDDGSSRIEFEAAKREAWPMPDALIASLLRNLRRDVVTGRQPPVAYNDEVP